MATTRHCTFCGSPVGEKAWSYIGSQRIWLCDSAECDNEARDADRGARDEAQWEAMQDGYERYL
jgi:hypothetical protein